MVLCNKSAQNIQAQTIFYLWKCPFRAIEFFDQEIYFLLTETLFITRERKPSPLCEAKIEERSFAEIFKKKI